MIIIKFCVDCLINSLGVIFLVVYLGVYLKKVSNL